jgi:hypothetical protein
VAVHLLRIKQILAARSDHPGYVCFGDPSYLTALKDVVRQCGLTWDNDVINEVFDHSCVHHVPAAVVHEGQELFDSMVAQPPTSDSRKNQAQLDRDSRAIEEMRLGEWQASQERMLEFEKMMQKNSEIERHLLTSQARLAESVRLFEQTTEALNSMQAKLIASQEREIRSWEHNEQLRNRLERFESHPVVGVALRSRRRLRGLIQSMQSGLGIQRSAHELGANGIPRS